MTQIGANTLTISLTFILRFISSLREENGESWNRFRFWQSKKGLKWENKRVKIHETWGKIRWGCHELERWRIDIMK